MFGIVLRDTVLASVFFVVAQAKHRVLLARLPSGALLQRCSLCCVFRVSSMFPAPPTNGGCCCQCPWNVFGPCRYPSVGCPPITRFAAHGLSECATETWFFSLRLCVFYTLKSTTTDIGFESTFAAAMVCFIHDDCVSFQWRGFSRGWLWVSLSFRHGDSANTGCTADIGLLIHPLRPNVCCNNAVIGVGAKLNLFAKYSAKFRRAIAAVLLDVASCVCLLVWPYIM